jgi:murein DD-endopeptidase MepM/ murein hydrolase activator NlpD
MLSRLLPLLLVLLATGCAIPRWPVEGPMSSPYGVRGSLFDGRIHHGVDIAVPTGTPIRAMAPGRVHFAGTMSGYGLVVMVDHRGGYRTVYAHLSEIHVRAGDRIQGRPVIGLSGATGRVTGPHLHFEVRYGGRAEDPVPLLGRFPRR